MSMKDRGYLTPGIQAPYLHKNSFRSNEQKETKCLLCTFKEMKLGVFPGMIFCKFLEYESAWPRDE